MDTFPSFITLVWATHLSILYHDAKESQLFTTDKDKEELSTSLSHVGMHFSRQHFSYDKLSFNNIRYVK